MDPARIVRNLFKLIRGGFSTQVPLWLLYFPIAWYESVTIVLDDISILRGNKNSQANLFKTAKSPKRAIAAELNGDSKFISVQNRSLVDHFTKLAGFTQAA